MTPVDLQRELNVIGDFKLTPDGIIGTRTKSAIIQALTMGPDTPISRADIDKAARRLRVTPAHIWTIHDVEAAGDAFIDGRPTILFEPHIFARHTGQRFNNSHPKLSSRTWNRALYPRSQAARYQQLVDAVALDVNAGFSSASYGAFQVLGQNWRSLGYKSAWDMVYQNSLSVGEQLETFTSFIEVNNLARHLRENNWAAFARGYNGPGYAQNGYDKKLAARFAIRSRA